jgi:hypothetical protein
MPTCEESGQFPEGKSLVFRLSQAPGPGSAIRRFTEFRCTVTDPAGGTVESTGTDSWRQYTRFVFPGAPQVQPGRYRSRWQGRLQAGEWIDIASGEHEVKPSLVVSVLDDSQFRNFRRIALIAALHVQVENATDTAMDAIGYIHDVDAGGYWATGLTADEKTSVDREIGRLDETQEYGLPVRYVRRIGPCQTASGWFLVPVKMVAAGGSPAVAVIVRDETGNQYRATLPERQPQTYGG